MLLQQLYIESRAIEIVTEVLEAIMGTTQIAPLTACTLRDYRRMRAIRDFIETDLVKLISLGVLARQVGASTATLQRQFNAVYGTTVLNYLRTRRLQRAREMLERDDKSVSEAAYSAGYRSPANFATAFKRHFGTSPKRVRARS